MPVPGEKGPAYDRDHLPIHQMGRLWAAPGTACLPKPPLPQSGSQIQHSGSNTVSLPVGNDITQRPKFQNCI